uniref:Synaptotagmin 12 n=1 Tax=Calidris pygmaea TaxID=425635 RepID=A0A8C3JDG3_9CHAR
MDTGHVSRYHVSVATSPPRWEIGIYAAGALALLGIAALNLWKLWRSGSYPAPSPFPNYDYRYLQQKYGAAHPDAKHKRGVAPGSQRALDKTSLSRKSSLRGDDTFESINELGSLELMSKDLGLAHYGPLKKSISADSLSSISSIGNNFGQDFTVGQVEVSMEYDGRAATLHVTLLQGKDLLEKEDARFESCFMRISLLPAEQIVGISRIQRSAYAVAFDERFSIPLDPAALEENSLRFSVFGIDEDERNVSTGVAELKLSDLDLATRPFNAWLYLQDMNKVSWGGWSICPPQVFWGGFSSLLCWGHWVMGWCVPQAVDTVGEILLSLSYLPTAERLTVVVVKAKNLVWTNGKVTAGERGVLVGTGSLGLLQAGGGLSPSFILHWVIATWFGGAAPIEDRPHQEAPPEMVPPTFSILQGKRVTDPWFSLSPHPGQTPSSRCTCCRTGGRSARRRQQ